MVDLPYLDFSCRENSYSDLETFLYSLSDDVDPEGVDAALEVFMDYNYDEETIRDYMYEMISIYNGGAEDFEDEGGEVDPSIIAEFESIDFYNENREELLEQLSYFMEDFCTTECLDGIFSEFVSGDLDPGVLYDLCWNLVVNPQLDDEANFEEEAFDYGGEEEEPEFYWEAKDYVEPEGPPFTKGGPCPGEYSEEGAHPVDFIPMRPNFGEEEQSAHPIDYSGAPKHPNFEEEIELENPAIIQSESVPVMYSEYSPMQIPYPEDRIEIERYSDKDFWNNRYAEGVFKLTERGNYLNLPLFPENEDWGFNLKPYNGLEYWISTIVVLTRFYPAAIKYLFSELDHAKGYFKLRFFEPNGAELFVETDDQFLFSGNYKTEDGSVTSDSSISTDDRFYIYGNGVKARSIWLSVLDKAIATLHGDYCKMEGHSKDIGSLFQFFTGCKSISIPLDVEDEELPNFFKFFKEGAMMVLETHQEENGRSYHRGFGVMGMTEEILHLYNPNIKMKVEDPAVTQQQREHFKETLGNSLYTVVTHDFAWKLFKTAHVCLFHGSNNGCNVTAYGYHHPRRDHLLQFSELNMYELIFDNDEPQIFQFAAMRHSDLLTPPYEKSSVYLFELPENDVHKPVTGEDGIDVSNSIRIIDPKKFKYILCGAGYVNEGITVSDWSVSSARKFSLKLI
ncbi:hypothetical protein PCE1_002817 [Barthelona sp. PCE]